MNPAALLWADPLGRLVALAMGWLLSHWLEPAFKRRLLQIDYDRATRSKKVEAFAELEMKKRVELLGELLGRLRARFAWLSGSAPEHAVNRTTAEAYAREIADWVETNHLRFPPYLREELFSVMHFAHWYAEEPVSPGRQMARSTRGQRVASAAWDAIKRYKHEIAGSGEGDDPVKEDLAKYDDAATDYELGD